MKKSMRATFDPKIFLAKVGDGKTITEYHKDQIVCWHLPVLRTSATNQLSSRTAPKSESVASGLGSVSDTDIGTIPASI